MANIYSDALDKNSANHVPLTPLSFLARAADIYPHRTSVVYGDRTFTWADTARRCRQVASALSKRGVGVGDTVAMVSANLPEMFEAHFAVPMTGAVLNAINMRLDAATVAFILDHGEANVVIVDPEFGALVEEALESVARPPLIIHINDATYTQGKTIGHVSYDDLISEGDDNYIPQQPKDEWQAISLNYTSGTTGNPKGVVYHHRGAYLNAVSNALTWNMGEHPVYLWTLPMFHCNGWCFPWTLALNAGTSVCLRQVRADTVFAAIRQNRVTHFCGAPIVLNTLLAADEKLREGIDHTLYAMTAGAAPPAAVIQGMEAIGIEITHTYGLTETYGPVTTCAWQDDLWGELAPSEKARMKSRQGVRGQMLEGLMVADPETLAPVPQDGKTIGEVCMRGNNVMKGYLKNPQTTAESLEGGWYRSGDLAVWYPDGYIQIKDRSKDIIISGGENISSIEIEDTLYGHPAIQEAAVVAKTDEKWGETPCAFVTLRPQHTATEEEILQYCRNNMARFKAPKYVVFTDLPKTSTGKIQKFELRKKAEQL